MNLTVYNLTIDVFFCFDDDSVQEFLYDILLGINSDQSDFRSLPFILLFEFSQSDIVSVLESVFYPVQPFPFFLE